MDLYAKVVAIGWVILISCSIVDDKLVDIKLLDIPYIKTILIFVTWGTLICTPAYMIYFIVAYL